MMIGSAWRFIDSGIQAASWNMAIDEALLSGFKEGDLPIFRLYGWENALSFGRFSTFSNNLNREKIYAQKISCVRRMSGGGVLVHGSDLSYTLILPRDWLREKGVKESYREVCRFLITLYNKLGFNAQFASDLELTEHRSDICLAGIQAYDIVIEGKKMGGNAQRHTHTALFQHGSIPMRIDEGFFNPFFREDSGLGRAASLEKLGTVITYEELYPLVKEAFCETFKTKLVSDILSLSEERRSRELYADKYTQASWTYHDE